MNWITITVLGAVAAWFEYSYQRSRHRKADAAPPDERSPDTETARVAIPGQAPSIAPGAENDKQLNSPL